MPAVGPVPKERPERRQVAGIARRRPGFVLALRPLARLLLRGQFPLQRGAAIRRRRRVRSRRKFGEKVGELIKRWSSAQPRPCQLLKLNPCKSLGDAAGEAREVIAKLGGVVARLDEVPVRQLLSLDDLIGQQTADCRESRLLVLLARSLLGVALRLR